MNYQDVMKLVQTNVIPAALHLLGAIVIWIIGRAVIKFAVNLISKALSHNKLDATLVRYLCSILTGLLTVFLVVGIIDYMGIPTTSFAALAAGVGLAIGAAWSGMLGNFAAGVFMIVSRPFQVGDQIRGGGTAGTVREIGLFATTFQTEDSVIVMVPNGKLFAGNISNYSTSDNRGVSVDFQVAFGVKFRPKMKRLQERLAKIPHIEEDSVAVELERFTVWGPVITAEADCDPAHYIAAKRAIMDAVDDVFGDMGFAAAPAPRVYALNAGKGADAEFGEDDEDEEGEEAEEPEEGEEEEEGEEGEEEEEKAEGKSEKDE
jgi:small conductance mechanosensitive channel